MRFFSPKKLLKTVLILIKCFCSKPFWIICNSVKIFGLHKEENVRFAAQTCGGIDKFYEFNESKCIK